MKQLRVAVVGATGRSGSLVIEQLASSQRLTLGSAIVSARSPRLGECVANGSSIRYRSDLEQAISECDLVIDFSTPEGAVRAAQAAARFGIPILVATTGLDSQQRADIEGCAKGAALLIAANTSVVVFVLEQLAALAQRLLGSEFDIEIFEVHHKMKRDAPSGTALSVAKAMQGEIVSARQGARRAGEIGISSARGGDVPGEHSVMFLGPAERLELRQSVRDRSVFARGALKLAESLLGRPPGLYTVADLYRPLLTAGGN